MPQIEISDLINEIENREKTTNYTRSRVATKTINYLNRQAFENREGPVHVFQYDLEGTLDIQNGKYRFERRVFQDSEHARIGRNGIITWDNALSHSFDTQYVEGSDHVNQTGLIQDTQNSGLKGEYFDTLVGRRVFDYDGNLSLFLKSLDMKIAGVENHNGSRAFVLKGSYANKSLESIDDSEITSVEVWIIAEKSFLPAFINISTQANRDVFFTQRLQDVTFDQADSHWFIKSGTLASQNSLVLGDGWSTTEVTLSTSEKSGGFPEDHFHIQFPPGTDVWNDLLQIGYRVEKA